MYIDYIWPWNINVYVDYEYAYKLFMEYFL